MLLYLRSAAGEDDRLLALRRRDGHERWRRDDTGKGHPVDGGTVLTVAGSVVELELIGTAYDEPDILRATALSGAEGTMRWQHDISTGHGDLTGYVDPAGSGPLQAVAYHGAVLVPMAHSHTSVHNRSTGEVTGTTRSYPLLRRVDLRTAAATTVALRGAILTGSDQDPGWRSALLLPPCDGHLVLASGDNQHGSTIVGLG